MRKVRFEFFILTTTYVKVIRVYLRSAFYAYLYRYFIDFVFNKFIILCSFCLFLVEKKYLLNICSFYVDFGEKLKTNKLIKRKTIP